MCITHLVYFKCEDCGAMWQSDIPEMRARLDECNDFRRGRCYTDREGEEIHMMDRCTRCERIEEARREAQQLTETRASRFTSQRQRGGQYVWEEEEFIRSRRGHRGRRNHWNR